MFRVVVTFSKSDVLTNGVLEPDCIMGGGGWGGGGEVGKV